MPMVDWNDKYSVEIQEIDEQHKVLVELINRLYDAIAAKKDVEQMGKIMDELVDYTKTHFAVEEALMRVLQYPDYEPHKAIHDRIVAQVVDFQTKFHAGDRGMGMELLMFLKNWLFDHINKIDKSYVPHFTKQGVKKSWLRKFW